MTQVIKKRRFLVISYAFFINNFRMKNNCRKNLTKSIVNLEGAVETVSKKKKKKSITSFFKRTRIFFATPVTYTRCKLYQTICFFLYKTRRGKAREWQGKLRGSTSNRRPDTWEIFTLFLQKLQSAANTINSLRATFVWSLLVGETNRDKLVCVRSVESVGV